MTHPIEPCLCRRSDFRPSFRAGRWRRGRRKGRPGAAAPPIILPPRKRPRSGSGAISGVVIDGATKAWRTLWCRSAATAGHRSADLSNHRQQGAVRFHQPAPASSYSIRASRFGYLDSGAGKDRVGIALREGEWISDFGCPVASRSDWRNGRRARRAGRGHSVRARACAAGRPRSTRRRGDDHD
jgi:hypothetical protein